MQSTRILALALVVGLAAVAARPAPAQTSLGQTSPAQTGAAPTSPGQGAVQASGRPGGGGRFTDKFSAANATHDGRLTLAQAQAGRMPAIVRNFASIDQAGRGYVTLADIRAWRRQRRSEHGLRPNAPNSIAPDTNAPNSGGPRPPGTVQPDGFTR